jgi:hypothetical protein
VKLCRNVEDRTAVTSWRKSMDTDLACGPWLATNDKVPDPGTLISADTERVGGFDVRIANYYDEGR